MFVSFNYNNFMRNVFLIIVFIFCSCQAEAAIEVISAGQRYDSIDTYKTVKSVEQAQQEAEIKHAKELGVTVDPTKMKTVIIKTKVDPLQQLAIQRLRWVSLAPPNQKDILAHPQSWMNPKPLLVRVIDSQKLENAIEKAVSQSSSAKMIVATDQGVKILGLSPR